MSLKMVVVAVPLVKLAQGPHLANVARGMDTVVLQLTTVALGARTDSGLAL